MMNQHEIASPVELLDQQGHLLHPGYATRMQWQYDPRKIKARPFALKEWDFFQVQLGGWVLQFTLGHVSYAWNAAVTLLHPADGRRESFSIMRPFSLPMMGNSPEGEHIVSAGGKGWHMSADYLPGAVLLSAKTDDGYMDVSLLLERPAGHDKMVIATPFDKPNQFYLNSKEHFPSVSGTARIGDTQAEAVPGNTALLDWGRGVWPFRQDWYWGCGSAECSGRSFGFNIGWGFGDLSHATENMLFIDGKAIKLGRIETDMDETALNRPWHFRDEDGILDMVMTPVYDNHTTTKLLWVDNSCHQVYGSFSGTVNLPDGGEFRFEKLDAFVEHAHNRW